MTVQGVAIQYRCQGEGIIHSSDFSLLTMITNIQIIPKKSVIIDSGGVRNIQQIHGLISNNCCCQFQTLKFKLFTPNFSPQGLQIFRVAGLCSTFFHYPLSNEQQCGINKYIDMDSPVGSSPSSIELHYQLQYTHMGSTTLHGHKQQIIIFFILLDLGFLYIQCNILCFVLFCPITFYNGISKTANGFARSARKSSHIYF